MGDDVDGDYFDSVLSSCLCKKYDQDQDLNHLLHVIFQEYWTGPLHCFNLDIWLSPFFCYSDHMHWVRKVARAQLEVFFASFVQYTLALP